MTDRMKQLLDELLEEDEKSHGNDAASQLQVHRHIHDRRRWRAHEAAKATQPKMKTACHAEDFAALVAFLRQPITPAEEAPGGLDQMAITVKECETAGNFHDLVFALARFYRKTYGENQWGGTLGPIQAERKKEA